jgi:hypothetical protein
MKILLSIVLYLVSPACAIGQECAVDSGFRGGRFSIQYEQRHLVKLFRSLDALPPNVRTRLDQHLTERLGPGFAKRLEFDEGEWLDLQKLRREFPSLYKKNLKLGAYDLLFRFSDHDKGLKYFYAKLALNDDGSVNEEIKLPNIGADPSKGRILSCKEAIDIAVGEGFPRERIFPWFEYSSEHDCFIWTLTDQQRIDPGMRGNGTYRAIDVNANTGKILRVYEDRPVF